MTPKNDDMNKLAELSSQLNTETDTLNDIFLSIEKRLAEMKIGLEFWCGVCVDPVSRTIEDYETRDKERVKTSWNLGYTKIGDYWRIAIRQEVDQYNPSSEEWESVDVKIATLTPLAGASRNLRIAFAEHLDELISGITRLAEKRIGEIQTAKNLASES